MDFEPHKGAIAFCSKLELGLITSSEPQPIDYKPEPECDCHATAGHAWGCAKERWCFDENAHGLAWTGIHLSLEKLGQPWSSRSPLIVGEIRVAPHELHPYYVVDGRNERRAHLKL